MAASRQNRENIIFFPERVITDRWSSAWWTRLLLMRSRMGYDEHETTRWASSWTNLPAFPTGITRFSSEQLRPHLVSHICAEHQHRTCSLRQMITSVMTHQSHHQHRHQQHPHHHHHHHQIYWMWARSVGHGPQLTCNWISVGLPLKYSGCRSCMWGVAASLTYPAASIIFVMRCLVTVAVADWLLLWTSLRSKTLSWPNNTNSPPLTHRHAGFEIQVSKYA